MRTSLGVIALAVCLGTAGLWAQSSGADLQGQAADQGQTATPGAASDQGAAAPTASSSEDEFFGSAQVEAPKGTAEKQDVADVVEKEHVGLSGLLQAMSNYLVSRSFVNGSGNLSDNTFSNLVGGDFLVDIRLQKGFKAFLDLNLGFVPGGTPTQHTFTVFPPSPAAGSMVAVESQETALLIKEVFVDFNIANMVNFRAGKQVLQWGTGYFWNPTDLINIEHRSFTNLSALRQGVFGLRSDVVFAPWWHLYTFVNLNGVTSADIWDTAFAARSEFLAGAVEFAASGWLKSGKIPVFGADLSMPLFWSLNLTAEGTLSWGDNQDKYDPVTGHYQVRDQLVGKVDVGLSRTFDAFDVKDRINVAVEFFYNSDGYTQNMFTYPSAPAFLQGGYFQSGYYGQYYGAAFVTINDFGTTNMTLTLSGLANFSDLSGTALAGWSWSPVNNFTLSAQLGTYLGADNREYTFAVNTSTGQVTSGNQLFGILTATVAF
jgi:hypothetical protein